MSLIQGQTRYKGESSEARTPLYSEYVRLAEEQSEVEEGGKRDLYEQRVIASVDWLRGAAGKRLLWFEEFRYVAQRMDLFSESFVRDDQPQQR